MLFLAFSIAYGLQATQIPLFGIMGGEVFTARTLPYALSAAGVAVSLLLLASTFRRREGQTAGLDVLYRGLNWPVVLALLVLMVAYGMTIRTVGFIVSTSLFLAIGYFLLGERRWMVILGASVPVVVVFWLLLTQLLGIYVEAGTLWAAFGGPS